MLLRSTDSGAPVLTGETGALYGVLKWALPTLGWTLAFDDAVNSRAAFRNNTLTGTGDYLRIADNPADHNGTDARMANVRSYSSMSDVNTGTDGVGDASWLIGKSMSADSTARPWAIVGDSTYFTLLIAAGNNNFYNEYYYGDIVSDKVVDAGAFLTQAITSTAISSNTISVPILLYGNNSLIGQSKLRFGVDGLTLGADVYYTQENYSGSISPIADEPGSIGTYPEPSSGGIRVVDVGVQHSDGLKRGRLKGSLRIMNNVIGQFSNFQVIPNQATARGEKDCVVVNRYARPNLDSGQGVLLFDPNHGDW